MDGAVTGSCRALLLNYRSCDSTMSERETFPQSTQTAGEGIKLVFSWKQKKKLSSL